MPRRINLVPKGERVRTATNVPALALMVGAVLVVFALGLGYFLLSNSRSSLQSELDGLQRERASLETQVAALSEYKALAAQRAGVETVVQGVYAGRTLVSQVLSDISRAVPSDVWFTNLSLSAGEVGFPSVPAAGASASTAPLGVGSVSVQGNTYSFEKAGLLKVQLSLVRGLTNITLNNIGPAVGSVDAAKNVRGFSLVAKVLNTQTPETPLPVSKVEVEGL